MIPSVNIGLPRSHHMPAAIHPRVKPTSQFSEKCLLFSDAACNFVDTSSTKHKPLQLHIEHVKQNTVPNFRIKRVKIQLQENASWMRNHSTGTVHVKRRRTKIERKTQYFTRCACNNPDTNQQFRFSIHLCKMKFSKMFISCKLRTLFTILATTPTQTTPTTKNNYYTV